MFRISQLSKRKQISLLLTFVLVLSLGAYILSQRFKADVPGGYMAVSIQFFDNDTKAAVSGVKITVNASQDANGTYPILSAVSNDSGQLNAQIPDKVYDQVLVEKDGYFDIMASFTLNSTNTPKTVSINMPLTPGFGLENVHIQSILPGDNLISTPLVPKDSDPVQFFTYYDKSESTSNPQDDAVVKAAYSNQALINDQINCLSSHSTLASNGTGTGDGPIVAGTDICNYTDWPRWPNIPSAYQPYLKDADLLTLENNPESRSYTITIPMSDGSTFTCTWDGCVSSPGSDSKGGNALIGSPLSQTTLLSNIGVTVGDNTYSMSEALADKTIEEISYFSRKDNAKVPITDPNTPLYPGQGFWLKTTNDDTVLSFMPKTTPIGGQLNISLDNTRINDQPITEKDYLFYINHYADTALSEIDQQKLNSIEQVLNSAVDGLTEADIPAGLKDAYSIHHEFTLHGKNLSDVAEIYPEDSAVSTNNLIDHAIAATAKDINANCPDQASSPDGYCIGDVFFHLDNNNGWGASASLLQRKEEIISYMKSGHGGRKAGTEKIIQIFGQPFPRENRFKHVDVVYKHGKYADGTVALSGTSPNEIKTTVPSAAAIVHETLHFIRTNYFGDFMFYVGLPKMPHNYTYYYAYEEGMIDAATSIIVGDTLPNAVDGVYYHRQGEHFAYFDKISNGLFAKNRTIGYDSIEKVLNFFSKTQKTEPFHSYLATIDLYAYYGSGWLKIDKNYRVAHNGKSFLLTFNEKLREKAEADHKLRNPKFANQIVDDNLKDIKVEKKYFRNWLVNHLLFYYSVYHDPTYRQIIESDPGRLAIIEKLKKQSLKDFLALGTDPSVYEYSQIRAKVDLFWQGFYNDAISIWPDSQLGPKSEFIKATDGTVTTLVVAFQLMYDGKFIDDPTSPEVTELREKLIEHSGRATDAYRFVPLVNKFVDVGYSGLDELTNIKANIDQKLQEVGLSPVERVFYDEDWNILTSQPIRVVAHYNDDTIAWTKDFVTDDRGVIALPREGLMDTKGRVSYQAYWNVDGQWHAANSYNMLAGDMIVHGIYGYVADETGGTVHVVRNPLEDGEPAFDQTVTVTNGVFSFPVASNLEGEFDIYYKSDTAGSSEEYIDTVYKEIGELNIPIELDETEPELDGSISIEAVNSTSVNVKFKTKEPVSGLVAYSVDEKYDQTKYFDEIKDNQTVEISDLTANQKYNYQLIITDRSGNFSKFNGVFTPFNITDIQVTPSETSVTISWKTSVDTKGWVDYGLTTEYGSTVNDDATYKKDHSVTISNLEPNKTYHYRIRAEVNDNTTCPANPP